MKKLITICAIVTMVSAFSGEAMADLAWKLVSFDDIVGGALSYDVSGDNVVVDGTAFYDKVQAYGNPVSFQKVGGDGVNNPVTGNFAFFGAFNYTDADNVFGWAQSIASTPLAIEIGAHPLNFDNGIQNEYFALDARGMSGTDYLTANFAELAAWGCTEIAPNIWMDIAVDTVNTQVAISIVMNGYSAAGWPDLNTNVMPGDLDPATSNWRDSGIRLAAVPEPATMSLLGLGALTLLRRKRKA